MSRYRISAIGMMLAGLLGACSDGDDGGVPNSPCAPDEAYFVENIWTPIVSVSCISCHNAQGVAKDSRLVLAMPTEPGFLQRNFEVMRNLAPENVNGTSILLLRPSGRHPNGHPGGVLFDADSSDYEAMAAFVGRVMGDEAACNAADVESCVAGAPGPQMLRRLSRTEYDNTIRDLFGFDSTWGAAFTADTVVNGFDNNAGALTVTPLLADQARKAAEEIATQAVGNLQALLPCDASGGRECARQFLATFGERMFRRPVTEDEVSRYMQVFDVGAEEDFATGIELVLSAMLQSPHFLYRSELGEHVGNGVYELTGYEIASELSYFLWGSMPDEELFAAARSGALADLAEIAAQTRRMLASPKSQPMLRRFTQQWLGIEQVAVVAKDSAVFPEFTADIRTAMSEEASRFVADIALVGSGTFADLLLSPYTIVNSALAGFYGVPAPASPGPDGYGRVDLEDGKRGGLLTLGAVLATHARPNSTSPIHRGKLVRERLLCEHLPPPPPGVNAEPPAVDPSLTTRERYLEHATNEACAGCHRLMDPIGFSFEHFDGIGRYRGEENGFPIDVSGTIVAMGDSDVDFQGADGLADILAQSPEAHACFALQWIRFAYGVKENAQLSCLIDEVQQAFATTTTIEDLIVSLTQTSHFTRRLGADDGTGEPGPGPGPGDPPDGGPGDPADPGDPGNGTDDLVEVEVVTDSMWETGSCHSATVTNISDQDVDWQVTLTVQGTMNNFWNAAAVQNGSSVIFSGVEWNNVIAPGQAASFGYCLVF